MALDGQVRQKRLDLGSAHFRGMALAVKEDEALRPIDVRGLRADRVVADADGVTHAIEQARWRRSGAQEPVAAAPSVGERPDARAAGGPAATGTKASGSGLASDPALAAILEAGAGAAVAAPARRPLERTGGPLMGVRRG